jgi:hypothetical protein
MRTKKVRSTIKETNVVELDEILLPYGHTAKLKQIEYENGMQILRMTIRQERRFTVLDLDPSRANDLGAALMNWAKAAEQPDSE